MNTPKVYLAGPITGLTYEQARFGWRAEAHDFLLAHGIDSYSPLRHGSFMYDLHATEDKAMRAKVITTRDRMDVYRADLLLVNFNDAKQISAGTCIEFGWADAHRIPIVTVMDHDNPHYHEMLLEISGYVLPTLKEALETTVSLLTPGA